MQAVKRRGAKGPSAVFRAFSPISFLLLSLLLLVGCGRHEKNAGNPPASPQAVSERAQGKPKGDGAAAAGDSADVPEDSSVSAPRAPSPDDVLAQATERFTESFSDAGENLPDTDRKLTISDETRDKYADKADILFSPTLEGNDEEDDSPRYLFRYRFEPNSEERWTVSHRLWKETSYGGMTRKIETVSNITRRWVIGSRGEGASDDALIPIEYYIDTMRLEQQEEGEEPILYNSQTDTVVPEEFRRFGTEKMIGVPLERFQIDPFGRMTEKSIIVSGFESDAQDSRVTVPFPEEPVRVGQSWTIPCTFRLKTRDETIQTIRGVQRFRLENVTGSLAVIHISMTVLSLVGDPYLEGQLAEKICEGTCRFDMENGRALKTELEFSKTVPNAFGSATILVYRCRITEERADPAQSPSEQGQDGTEPEQSTTERE